MPIVDEKHDTVPCEKCDKALSTESTADGTQMVMLDGSRINICYRCAERINGVSPEDFDAVWKGK